MLVYQFQKEIQSFPFSGKHEGGMHNHSKCVALWFICLFYFYTYFTAFITLFCLISFVSAVVKHLYIAACTKGAIWTELNVFIIHDLGAEMRRRIPESVYILCRQYEE